MIYAKSITLAKEFNPLRAVDATMSLLSKEGPCIGGAQMQNNNSDNKQMEWNETKLCHSHAYLCSTCHFCPMRCQANMAAHCCWHLCCNFVVIAAGVLGYIRLNFCFLFYGFSRFFITIVCMCVCVCVIPSLQLSSVPKCMWNFRI